MTSLLDVNVIVALLDPDHIFHDRAHRWFSDRGRGGWATCPLTENGTVRILGHRHYPKGPGSPAAAADLLEGLCKVAGHEFWPNEISLLRSPHVDAWAIGSSAGVTDTYLLALAVGRGGRFATFDRRLSAAAVRGGSAALHPID